MQVAHPRTAPGRSVLLHFECRGAPARVRVWRCEGRPPLPHHFVCVETFTVPYLIGSQIELAQGATSHWTTVSEL